MSHKGVGQGWDNDGTKILSKLLSVAAAAFIQNLMEFCPRAFRWRFSQNIPKTETEN
jgi:hypothetical protein